MKKEICEAYRIDYREGIQRFRGNEEFYSKLLGMFLQDNTFSRMKAAKESNDLRALFENAHEMKGVSGNVSLSELFQADCVLLEYLRSGGTDMQQVDSLFLAVEEAYHKTCEGVRLVLAE